MGRSDILGNGSKQVGSGWYDYKNHIYSITSEFLTPKQWDNHKYKQVTQTRNPIIAIYRIIVKITR